MNKCVFLGRIVAPAELFYTGSGTARARFTLAVDGGSYTNKDGETVSQVDFLDFTAWDKTAEFVAKYWTTKGKPMLVESEARQEKWEDSEGQKRSKVGFRVLKANFTPTWNQDKEETEDEEDTTPKKTNKNDKKSGGFKPNSNRKVNNDDDDEITSGPLS